MLVYQRVRVVCNAACASSKWPRIWLGPTGQCGRAWLLGCCTVSLRTSGAYRNTHAMVRGFMKGFPNHFMRRCWRELIFSFSHHLIHQSIFQHVLTIWYISYLMYLRYMIYWLVVSNFVMFHNIWDNPSHWLIFFRGVETTNQYMFQT